MLSNITRVMILSLCFITTSSCSTQTSSLRSNPTTRTKIIEIQTGSNVEEQLLEALIRAKPGTVIQLGEGMFEFTQTLSLTVPGVTVEGKGMDKTILSFAKQNQGKEGLLVNVGDFVIQNLTIEDTKSDALKIVGGKNVIIKQVRTRWTAGPLPTNGGYGIYPVQCSQVIIEECEAECASDAGIYVGQSEYVLIHGCKASRNVAGIEVENSTHVDVYDNVATNNTGGILVFDLPDLPKKNGNSVRVFRNKVFGNNHENFAPAGNIVATVPPGTGMMILATDLVECFNNEVKDNQTTGLAIISYHLTQKPIQDKEYDPYPEGIFIHDNNFSNNGSNPSGELGKLLVNLIGKPMPDILYDGNVNPAKLVDGKLPENLSVKLSNNGNATFANIQYNGKNLLAYLASKPQIDRSTSAHEGTLPALPAVEIRNDLR